MKALSCVSYPLLRFVFGAVIGCTFSLCACLYRHRKRDHSCSECFVKQAIARKFLGYWKCKVTASDGTNQSRFTMELLVAPIDDPKMHNFTIIYSGAAVSQKRP